MNPVEYPSLWNVPANPVFRRHAVSALRPLRLVVWILITQVMAGFFWVGTVLLYLQTRSPVGQMIDFGSPEFRRMLADHGENASLLGWLSVLVIQGLLVVVKGTFSVATGVAREANEGMIEAERLSPLPTGHKVAGQLLGLPLLEVLLGVLLLPWAILSAWMGGLSAVMMGKVYLIFATSAVFHHAVGLMAGTLIRQKILAGTLSQILILLLHFVLPTFGGIGIGLISHLGAEAAMLHEVVKEMPHLVETGGLLTQEPARAGVDFYQWEVALSGYHWVITLSALAALLLMLFRRWEDPESQWLGKAGTSLLAVWIMVLTCGELLPPFWRGEGLASAAAIFDIRWGNGYLFAGHSKTGAAIWIAGFGLALGVSNLLLTGALVPSPVARHRITQQGGGRWWSDGRSAVPWVIGISLLAAAAWAWVVSALLGRTEGLQGMGLEMSDGVGFAGAIMVPALALHALALRKGWKLALAGVFACWMVPPMVAGIGLLAGADAAGWPMWVAGLSGPMLPAYAALGMVAEGSFGVCAPVLLASLLAHGWVGIVLLARNSTKPHGSAANPGRRIRL